MIDPPLAHFTHITQPQRRGQRSLGPGVQLLTRVIEVAPFALLALFVASDWVGSRKRARALAAPPRRAEPVVAAPLLDTVRSLIEAFGAGM